MTRITGVVLGSFAMLALAAGPVGSMCHLVPCRDCWIESRGQLNLVVMDRAAGMVQVVPNVNFQGVSADFGIVVPTPTLPSLEPLPADVWDDAFALTAPIAVTRSQDSSPFSCSETRQPTSFGQPAGSDPVTDQEVTIHSQQTVGAFDATILSSQDPNALIDWLQQNQFDIATEDAEKFGPYVERGWYFTAMKPNPSDPQNQMPAQGWNNNVNPVLFQFEADEFEFPLPLMSINRAETFPVVMYVVDRHRAALEGFNTVYANKLTDGEYQAIVERHPSWERFLGPGRYLTRLDRTFGPSTRMDHSLFLKRASTNAEFRRTWGGFRKASIPFEALVLVLLVAVPIAWLRRRTKRIVRV